MDSNALILREHLQFLKPYVGPRTLTEQKLAEIWREALSMDTVGIADKYDDLGGSSLLAASIFAEIEDTFGIKVPMSLLVEAPTIEQLARHIDRLQKRGN